MPDLSESPTTEMKGPVFNRVANYFAGQPYGNLIATLMLCGFAWWFWWSQTVGEPQKIKQVQDGLTDAIKQGSDAAKAQAEQHAAAVKSITESHTENIRAMIDHAEKASERRSKEESHREQLLRELMGHPRDLKNNAEGRDDRGAVMETNPDFPLTG